MSLLRGVDVSSHNAAAPTTITLDFGVIRATYAVRSDTAYARNLAAFRRNAKPVGAYHFGVRWLPVSLQVAAFLRRAADADFLALDVEKDGRLPRMTDAQARDFLRRVQATGRRIGLYMSESAFRDLGQDWDWVAHYGLPGASQGHGGPGRAWDMWQWQGSPIDRNWLRGSLAAFLTKAGNRSPATAPAPIPPPKPAPTPAPLHPPIPLEPTSMPFLNMVQPPASFPLQICGTTSEIAHFGADRAWISRPITLPGMRPPPVDPGPILVLVHGGPGWPWNALDGVVGNLAAVLGWTAIAIGWRDGTVGPTGESDTAPADIAAALRDIRTAHPGRRLVVVAHSWGGQAAGPAVFGPDGPDAYVAVAAISPRALAGQRPSMPVSVVIGTRDPIAPGDDKRAFVAALAAAGHPGVFVAVDADHTTVLYARALADAIVATAALI